MAGTEVNGTPSTTPVVFEISLLIVSPEAILKTCYWFSRDYVCEVKNQSDSLAHVILVPKSVMPEFNPNLIRDAFLTSAMDFALREKIEAKTSGIRDVLLAKAFSESGVLEDAPDGVFGDRIEESKPDSMFKILSNPQH
jgi:radical SAM pair-associated protein